jgi:HEAT repeats
MNIQASTAPHQPRQIAPDIIGCGGTDAGSIDALFGQRPRFVHVGSGTAEITLAAVHPGSPLIAPTEKVIQNFPNPEADVAGSRWNERRGLLTFHSPTLILTTLTTRPMRLCAFTRHVADRTFTLPIHWNLASALDAATAQEQDQSAFPVVSSTDPLPQPSYLLRRQVALAFATAEDDLFEDGMESEFSGTLRSLLTAHGAAVVTALDSLDFSSTANPEVAFESLKWLGTVDHDESRQSRRRLLERLLSSPSARIRYAAALGLAAMDDPVSLAALRGVIKRETHPRLRQYFQLVADQLEATQQCISS